MPPVYVSQQGAHVKIREGRLVVVSQEQTLLSVPLEEVDQLTVLGRGVQVSTAAMADLVKRGVEISYLSQAGRFLARVAGASGGAVQLRMAQYQWVADPERALTLAGALVAAKITNQRLVLSRLGVEKGATELGDSLARLRHAGTVDQLRGMEGAAAACYFRAIIPLFPSELGFHGRAHHPPPDPANAALSFGYTLLLTEVIGQLNVVGLDPYAGFLHALEPGRPNLALDMEEELRPAIDDLVLGLFHGGGLRRSDFGRDGDGIRMAPEARKRFLMAYHEVLAARVSHPLARGRVALRQAIELQARQLGRVLAGERETFETIRLLEIWG